MSDNKNEILDIDLDTLTLDDIEDMPEFMPLPTGGYILQGVKAEQKEVGDHSCVQLDFKVAAVLELNAKDLESEEKAPEEGAETNFLFMIDNKFGLGSLKEILKPVAVKFGTSKVPDLLNIISDGLQLVVVIKRTFDKKKDRFYSKIKKVGLAE